ncbi:Hypothetical Protein FCC1311_101362 [Hondaea fermentalgiana]|uniref:Uncharacterized protein n=1 Tax=Hondaea fermentalgiana TaxID=2315210 RepID=A0A2R5GYU9_9STRA|nr:Hypothetical Protein FCC1311_101362 [Hondaea fermentalgiana]|eukprot:GBG33913.1 Hypothetical Protein FCC1311_101362 [Hondaea fermentalgiana]
MVAEERAAAAAQQAAAAAAQASQDAGAGNQDPASAAKGLFDMDMGATTPSVASVGALGSYAASAASALAIAGLGNYYAWRFVLGFIFLPSQVVYMARQKELEEARTAFLKEVKRASRVSIPVGDENTGIKLDGILLRHPSPSCRKYFVQFNANGVCYEEKLSIACDVQQTFKAPCHLLFVNYRGVGASEGRTTCGLDLVNDGRAVLEWLRQSKGASFSDVLVHGHSIGGAVAVIASAAVAQQDRKKARVRNQGSSASSTASTDSTAGGASASASAPPQLPFVIADRTFSTLGNVVSDKLTNREFDLAPIGGIMLIDLAAVVFSVARVSLGWSPPSIPGLAALTALGMSLFAVRTLQDSVSPTWPFDRYLRTASTKYAKAVKYGVLGARTFVCSTALLMFSSFFGPAWEYTVYLAVFGVLLARRGWLNAISLRLVRFLGWDMDVTQAWNALPQDRKLLLAHPRDGMIPTHVSLLKSNDPCDKVILTSSISDPHMYDFFVVASERGQVLQAANLFFHD